MPSAAAPAPRPPQAAPPPQQPTAEQQRKALAVNSIRLKAITDRLRPHLRGAGVIPPAELANITYAFARGIDFALSAGHVPDMAGEIPEIVRKVYEMRRDQYLQSCVMVLMISCKNACLKDWFQATDSADILRMATEICANFCTSNVPATNDSIALEIISKIMPRYYPQLKFERLIKSIEAKVGYDILMEDFFIERTLPRDDKIRLIVVQKDNLDTSSCITSPSHVSFLVNGKGVDRRTNVLMETGPQFPTDITKMLKYGANIIQAVGYFNASYIIAIAFVNNVTPFNPPRPGDYAQSASIASPDSDVLEGPSRVSLNCPISLMRIKTPIKGQLCKHYQCFDYDNYVGMNLRKPTWRCPFCNTPSNFTDLRLDQMMTKILQETGDDVNDVLVFADGSWKAAPSHDEKSDKHAGDAIKPTGDTMESDGDPCNVIDLINGNDDGDLMDLASSSEDSKPLLNNQDLSFADYLPDLAMNAPAQAEGLRDGSTGISNMATSVQNLPQSSCPLGASSFGTLESILPQNVLRPVITDAVSPSHETSTSTSGMQYVSQGTHPELGQLQPQIGLLHGLEVGRPPIPRNVRREPIGVQALPVPTQNPGSSRRLQPNTFNCPPPAPLSSSASSTYQAHRAVNPDSAMNNGGGSLPRVPSAIPLRHIQSTTLDMRNTSNHQPSRAVGHATPQHMGVRTSAGVPGQAGGGANAYRAPSAQPILNLDQLMLHASRMNQTALAAVGQTSAAAQALTAQTSIQSQLLSAQRSQALRSQTVPRAATQHTQLRPTPRLQCPSVPTVPTATPLAVASDDLPEIPVDENWCPTGRMRGSLTGSAYSSAIRRYLGESDEQQSQPRPPSTDGRRPH
ncbi:hypothetical protein ACP4OV_006691 [Aristida adscensionis]